MAWNTPSTQITGDLMTAAIWNQNVVYNTIALTPSGILWIFDGGGGVYGIDEPMCIEVPFKCDIDRVTMLHDVPSTTQIDIWKDTYENYPPTVGNSITASAVPATSAAIKDQDVTLSGWTPTIAAGDILAANVDNNDLATRTTLSLKVSRS